MAGPCPQAMPSTDGRTDGQTDSYARGERGGGEPRCCGPCAIHAGSPRGFSEPRRGEGQGGRTLACASSPAAAGAAQRGRARRGAGGAPRAPVGPPLPAPPPPSPDQGQGAQALLSAGLSPRAVASSLKEGRSLGLGAQQRCISLASRAGQPSGGGSFVFPDCSPAKTSSSACGL